MLFLLKKFKQMDNELKLINHNNYEDKLTFYGYVIIWYK